MAELSTLGRPYAKAAFEYAVEANALQQWSEMLELLATVSLHPRVRQRLESPNFSATEQAQMLLDLVGEELDEKVSNLVTALGSHRRLALLPVIRQQFEVLKANREKSIDVEVQTADAIEQSQQEQLTRALTRRLDRTVNVTVTENKSLLGGVLIRAGDTIIDGSVRGRLLKLAEALNS